MAVIKDAPDKFEKYQSVFVQELIGIVKIALADSNIAGLKAKPLSSDIAFAIASFLDGGGDYCFIKDDEFRPVIAFKRKGEDNSLCYSEGGAMHEEIDGQIDFAFKHSI
jgi:hypothetical protein